MAEQLTKLEREAEVLSKEIEQLRTTVTELDPDGTPSLAALQAQKRLDKATDDYRMILTAVAAAQKGVATDAAGVNIPDRGRWEKVNGEWVNTVAPAVSNPDEDVSKAVKRQNDEAERNERIANEKAGKGYLTAKEVADISNVARARNYDDARLQQEIAKQGAENRREDAKLEIEQAKLAGTLAKTGAETAQIGAATDLTRAQMAALEIKTASDADRAFAAGLLDKAQADKIKVELAKPEAVPTTTDQQFLARRDPSGQLITDINPNYQGPKAPTTRVELAQRVALLQSQMAQMKDKIAADKSIPADQQAARFNAWYDQNMAPQVGALDQQQQLLMSDEAQKTVESQQKNLASATAAFSATAPYRVGPGYGKAFESLVQDTANTQFAGGTEKPVDLGTGWSTYKGPNLDEHIQNLVSNQQQAPVPGMDLQGLLGRSQWTPGGGAAPPLEPMPAAAGAPPPAEAMPAGPGGPPTQMPFGAIGNNPMLAAIQARNRQLASQQTAAATGNPNNTPFGAIGPGGMPPPMPQPVAAMPQATGSGPLAYAPFRPLIPYLQGATPQQFTPPWVVPGGGGGGAGFTP